MRNPNTTSSKTKEPSRPKTIKVQTNPPNPSNNRNRHTNHTRRSTNLARSQSPSSRMCPSMGKKRRSHQLLPERGLSRTITTTSTRDMNADHQATPLRHPKSHRVTITATRTQGVPKEVTRSVAAIPPESHPDAPARTMAATDTDIATAMDQTVKVDATVSRPSLTTQSGSPSMWSS